MTAFQTAELFNRADILDCKNSKFKEKMLKMNVICVPLVMYFMQMRTSPKSLVKVLGIDQALSQDIKGDLRTLHDLLTISDHQFKRILSSNLSFSFEHIKKMKAERQEYTEFLSQVADVQASKLNKASATLKDYFQLHGKAFSKIHDSNLSFAERQDLCDFYDHNQKIEKVVRRACLSCGLEGGGSDYQDAVEKFRKHGIQTKYDFHCLDEDVLLDRLSELNNWKLCDALIRTRDLREKKKRMLERSFGRSRREIFCSVRYGSSVVLIFTSK